MNNAKLKCITYSKFQSVKSQSSSHQNDEDLQGDLLVNVHTSMHVMVSGQIPHIWGKFWCQIKVKCPTFPLYSLGEGSRGIILMGA